MAEEMNGAAPPAPPRLQILTQYTRDLSFENIAAQKGVASSDSKPEVTIQVGVNANNRGDDRFEVVVKLKVSSLIAGAPLFIAELDYAGLFLIQNMPPEQMHPLMMIECPRLLFPFIRRIISDVTRDGGFPQMNLDIIDFVALYRNEMARQQAEAESAPAQA